MAQSISKEKNPLVPNQVYVATQTFIAEEDTDLPFELGDRLTIIEPCELMFWYRARDEQGREGIIPGNFLRPLDTQPKTQAMVTSNTPTLTNYYTDSPAAAASTTTAAATVGKPLEDDGYMPMNPANTHVQSPPTPAELRMQRELFLAYEKEKHRRLSPGTLVVATQHFDGQAEGDLSFSIFDELLILKALPDLCWYSAQRTDRPDLKGNVPVTHIRLVYMSDDEEDITTVQQQTESDPLQDSLYDDISDFKSQSGWFSFPGIPQNNKALEHVLAKHCRLSYDRFMSIKEAVYKFDYRNGEKCYVGKATVLHEEMMKHFAQFGKRRTEIREIDDELCHHTDMGGWDITVWPLENGEDIEVETAKKIIEKDALTSKDGGGITEEMTFTSVNSFDRFWQWLFPDKPC